MNAENELDILIAKIKSHTQSEYDQLAIEVFHHQYKNNPVYRNYVNLLGKDPNNISEINQIPFLPISTFKTHQVVTGTFVPEVTFESSGTTGSVASKHRVKSLELYKHSFIQSFTAHYGNLEHLAILCLLPSYLERGGSSLVYMADKLIKISNNKLSGFFLNDFHDLAQKIQQLESEQKQALLLGVSYALLDFGESFPMSLKFTTIMETGGMKGRRKELPKIELHQKLSRYFGVSQIHAEYGMTELMSQAYSKGMGLYQPGHGMKIRIRREDDPLEIKYSEKAKDSITGGINVIDLYNVHSCSFIATEDLGRLHHDGSFEVLGRLENSEIRGCGLMYTG